MQAALAAAGLAPEEIDYINLHGTATPSNDRSESHAVAGIFGPATPGSSTKGATGHTLGAAGALEGSMPRGLDLALTGRSARALGLIASDAAAC